MTTQPALPAALLAVLAVVILGARAVALRHLLTTERPRQAWWRWGAVTVAALLLLATAVRPVLGGGDAPVVRAAGDRQPNIFLVVDRSADMAGSDIAARDDMADVVDRYPNARIAVIGFASAPTLEWPLSADVWSLKPVLAAPAPASDTADGRTDVGAAGTVLRYQLISATQQYPHAQNLVFYFGAGSSGSEVPQREFRLPDNAVDGGAVFGYRGPEDGPEASSLRVVADQLGLRYVQRSGSGALDADLPDGGDPAQEPVVRSAGPGFELYWAFAAVAATLLLIELYLVLREFGRNRPREPGMR